MLRDISVFNFGALGSHHSKLEQFYSFYHAMHYLAEDLVTALEC